MPERRRVISRLLAVVLLAIPIACDDVYGCGFEHPPDDEPHEPEIAYPTEAGRYTVTIETEDPWPPRTGEVSFELWPTAPSTATSLELSASPAFRSTTDPEQDRPAVPLAAIADGAWMVGPVRLDAGLWHVPVQLSDDEGLDRIELRIEVVGR